MSSVTKVAPLLVHGPLFARPSKPFAALGLHFWRPCGTNLLVFEVNLTPISFSMRHIQTRNQPASSLVTIKVSHRQSEVSRKYVAKNALLAHSSCARSAAITSSIYLYIWGIAAWGLYWEPVLLHGARRPPEIGSQKKSSSRRLLGPLLVSLGGSL